MTLSFMIMKKYLREKLEEQQRTGQFIERREYKPFWRARIGAPGMWKNLRKANAAFLCGRYVFYANIKGITITETPIRLNDVIESKVCYEITCRFDPDELKELETFVTTGLRDKAQ